MGDPPAHGPAPAAPPRPPGEGENTSGRGRDAWVPPEVRRWNWGAFFLGIFWGLPHRVWISLVGLLPLGTVVMPFVLGAKGGEWAWQNKHWRDLDHFRKVQKRWAVAGLLFTATWVTGAAFLVAEEVRKIDEAEKPLTIASEDGSVALTVSRSWRETRGFAGADLQIAHREREEYVAVVSDPVGDYAPGLSVEELSDVVLARLVRRMDGHLVGGRERIELFGYPALQQELTGTVDEAEIVMLHTTIDAGERYVQVFAWTRPSNFRSARPTFDSILSRMRIRGGGEVEA